MKRRIDAGRVAERSGGRARSSRGRASVRRARTAAGSERLPAWRAVPRARSRASISTTVARPRQTRGQPIHPGAVLRDEVLPRLGMSQQELARRLAVSRETVNLLVGERRNLSVELAVRIAKLLGHAPQKWIGMQVALDLWRIARRPQRLAAIEPLPGRIVEV